MGRTMSPSSFVPLAIDYPAFHKLFDDVAAIGRTEKGGLYRLAASVEEGLARDHVCAWLKARGFEICIDPVGNVFALLPLAGPHAPWVLSGSHLDSQPRGGRYDGAYGVLGACIVADAIRTAWPAQSTHNLAVVIWTNEEGARFSPSMLGSGVYAGHYDSAYALSREDAQGVSLKTALSAIGYHGTGTGPADPRACIELHIEQGPELEKTGSRIGVVEGNWGTMKYIATMHGMAAHTGPTPMQERHDALLGAAHLVVACRLLSDETSGELLTSVGRLDIEPNSSNVVAEQVKVFAEMRATDNGMLAQSCAAFELAAAESATRAKVRLELQKVTNRPAGLFDAGLCELVERAAERHLLSSRRLFTVAGHDAVSLRSLCRTAMIFVPSAKGISHNEAEFTEASDLEAGLDVLGEVLLQLVCASANENPT